MGQADRTVSLLRRLSGVAVDREGLVARLAPGSVRVFLGEATAREPQGQLLFTFAVNLIARLYPVVQQLELVLPRSVPAVVHFPRWLAGTLDAHVRCFLRALRPPLQWSVVEQPVGQAGCVLAIGDDGVGGDAAVFAGSESWIATVSPIASVRAGGAPNPVGAYAAACMAVAEVCKRLLAPHSAMFPGVPILPARAPLSLSTFSYMTDDVGENPELPARIDLRRLTLVGLGAGGAAMAHTLASTGRLHGLLTVIEPDEVTDTNLNRLVIADAADAEIKRPKAELARPLFAASPGLRVNVLPTSYGKAAPRLRPEDYRYVVATVHSREARRELQYETPMVLWDAGATEHGDFWVWRMVLGTTLCMYCKHPTGAADPEQVKALQLAAQLGLDAGSWLRKVRDNEYFNADEIAQMRVGPGDAGLAFTLPRAGQRFGDWEADQCGRLKLPDVDDEVPIPFSPVMAGVLLAGEVLKERYFPDAVLDSYYWNTLLGGFMARNRPQRRLPSPSCDFCHDPVYQAQYQKRWGLVRDVTR